MITAAPYEMDFLPEDHRFIFPGALNDSSDKYIKTAWITNSF